MHAMFILMGFRRGEILIYRSTGPSVLSAEACRWIFSVLGHNVTYITLHDKFEEAATGIDAFPELFSSLLRPAVLSMLTS